MRTYRALKCCRLARSTSMYMRPHVTRDRATAPRLRLIKRNTADSDNSQPNTLRVASRRPGSIAATCRRVGQFSKRSDSGRSPALSTSLLPKSFAFPTAATPRFRTLQAPRCVSLTGQLQPSTPKENHAGNDRSQVPSRRCSSSHPQ